eukprot:Lithocolla_globosa_v1_NODE_2993_length_1802_cov_15.983400.p1 type:complete len:575 gc:universal NODE_2993_length_1802_cov_15.983400:47-1771(+)
MGVDVCSVDELQNGEMKEMKVDGGKVLLSRIDGEYYATGHQCTHYRAPLVKGTLSSEGRVMCPWHGACWNVKSGDIEDAPALDHLETFPVSIQNGRVLITLPNDFSGRRRPRVCKKEKNEPTVVIVGGGAAAYSAAQTLREENFTGRVVMISRDSHVPIDRVKLSKGLKVELDKITLRDQTFFDDAHIELMLKEEVTKVDPKNQTVSVSSGSTIKYTNLLVATGGDPRFFWGPEAKALENVFLVRTIEDAKALERAFEEKVKPNVVVIGSSFIGMEAAATMVKSAETCTVVGMEKVPFERVLGPEIGAAMQTLHASKGVQFRMSATVEKFEAQDNKATEIVLQGGERLPCDIVVVGAGVSPATGFLRDTLPLFKDGSVVVNEYLEVSGFDHIYAAGDIARYPYHLDNGTDSNSVRIEHWSVALQQGKIAARNILGKSTPFVTIPYFWTQMYGKSVRYCGHALSYDDIIVDGDISQLDFAAFFVKKENVVAVASMGRDPVVAHSCELMRSGSMPSASALRVNKKLPSLIPTDTSQTKNEVQSEPAPKPKQPSHESNMWYLLPIIVAVAAAFFLIK